MFASKSDLFVRLSASVTISKSYYFGFCLFVSFLLWFWFLNTQLETALKS